MKLTLTFEKKDFASLREFGKSVERQVGKTYVGTDNFCAYFEYSDELKALLRPSQAGSEKQKELLTQLEKGAITFEVESSREESKI